MRVAVIDLGTNTFNLLIVDITAPDQHQMVYNTKMAVKIGEGAMIKGRLLPEPMARGKAALSDYLKVIEEYNCDSVWAFATSGIRSTENGGEFVREVKDELGLEIKVIDGNEEAQLIFEGVDLAVKFDEQPMVIMDIGGGSTEFIIANSEGVLWKKSYRLGISRVLQRIEPNDPLQNQDFENLDRIFNDELAELVSKCREFNVKTLIGSSGSFDSFAEMMWAEDGVSKTTKDIVSEEMALERLSALNDRLVSMNSEQRYAVPGLVEMRVDTIHLASYMVQWVLQSCRLERLLLSTYALKEGVLHRIMKNRL